MPSVSNNSIGDKAVALTTYTAANVGTALAPFAPGNTEQVGGVEINLIAHGVNSLVQIVKRFGWFKQDEWALTLALLLSMGFCLLVWHDQLGKWVINWLGTLGNILINYPTLNKLEVLPPAPEGV